MSFPLKLSKVVTDRHFEAIMGISIKEIDSIISQLDFYKEKTFLYYSYLKKSKKKNGLIKSREISPACHKLSYVQDRIKDRILNQIPLPDYIKGGRKGEDGLSNAKPHKGKVNHFCTDIKDFFPYVNFKKVYQAFIDIGFKPDFARRLTRLTTFKGKLPQGTSTSPGIANIVFYLEVDRRIELIIKEPKIAYTRYVDDLTFSSQQNFQYLVPDILKLIGEAGFLYSFRKTYYKKGKIDITGVNVGNNGLKATQTIKEKLCDPLRSEKSKAGLIRYIERVKAA